MKKANFFSDDKTEVDGKKKIDVKKVLEQIPTAHWENPLHYACFSENVELVRVLVEIFKDVNTIAMINGAQFTPLHIAAGLGNIEIVEILIENGADINAKCLYFNAREWAKYKCLNSYIFHDQILNPKRVAVIDYLDRVELKQKDQENPKTELENQGFEYYI